MRRGSPTWHRRARATARRDGTDSSSSGFRNVSTAAIWGRSAPLSPASEGAHLHFFTGNYSPGTAEAMFPCSVSQVAHGAENVKTINGFESGPPAPPGELKGGPASSLAPEEGHQRFPLWLASAWQLQALSCFDFGRRLAGSNRPPLPAASARGLRVKVCPAAPQAEDM